MERSIPHIRSIFSNPSSRKKSTSDTQDLCQYEDSPRSRRKLRDHDYYDKPHEAIAKNNSVNPPKKTPFVDKGKENNHKSKEEPRKSNRNGNYNTYTSKTLTEKDMRHLERHLSMKKTIRKQISRNLAQAFLENPDIFEPDDSKADGYKHDHILPASGKKSLLPKIAKSEQNVLDLLKVSIEDRDSGHSSPTHNDSDCDEDEDEEIKTWKTPNKHRDSETKGLMDDSKARYVGPESEKKSTSIWKMFSSRSKSKR